MGQREKARAIVDEKFAFVLDTTLGLDEIVAAVRRAAEASNTRMNGKFNEVEPTEISRELTNIGYSVVGPGGFIQMMSFMVSVKLADDGKYNVRVMILDFIFQKGSLGMKPTINAGRVMTKFVGLLKTELAAG